MPGDLPPPRLVTARGALRRSLILWGWGQLATGDRRGLALLALEAAAILAFVFVGWPLASGATSRAVFLGAVLFVAAWAGVGLHAYRRAVRRRETFGLPGADGGAIELLWLAPLLILGATWFWSVAGAVGSPEATVAGYGTAWRHERPSDAGELFAQPVDPSAMGLAWKSQVARLRNELIRVQTAAGPRSGIDPEQPFDSLRFELVDEQASTLDRRLVRVEIVRREAVRDTFFGLFPTSSQRLVSVAELGWIELRLVRAPIFAGGPTNPTWRVVRVDLLGEHLGE